MSQAPAGLRLYRAVSALAQPLLPLLLRRRAARGHEEPGRLAERLGYPARPRPPGTLIWIHGASVGEALSALPLLARLRGAIPGAAILLTTITTSSARLIGQRLAGHSSAHHHYAPLDSPRAADRFLDHWRPDLALWLESELWPNLLTAAHARRIPMALVNARLSPASFRRWRRFAPGLARHLLACFDLCLAQDRSSLERLQSLGAPRAQISGNLKYDARPGPAAEDVLERWRTALAARPCWLAASTHQGEEDLAAQTHRRLAAHLPNLLTLIAPRHPDRAGRIARRVQAQGLHLARRSAHRAPPPPEADIYLIDTLGELDLFYRLAPVVFMGGSFIRQGGHNPLEAARLDSAIVTGPHLSNFADLCAQLAQAGGLRILARRGELAPAVQSLLQEPQTRTNMARAAAGCAQRLAGALDRVMEALGPLLDRARP